MSAAEILQGVTSVLLAGLALYALLLGQAAVRRDRGPDGAREARPLRIFAAVLSVMALALWPAAEPDPVETFKRQHERRVP